jgi:hypothetical protein
VVPSPLKRAFDCPHNPLFGANHRGFHCCRYSLQLNYQRGLDQRLFLGLYSELYPTGQSHEPALRWRYGGICLTGSQIEHMYNRASDVLLPRENYEPVPNSNCVTPISLYGLAEELHGANLRSAFRRLVRTFAFP